MILRRFTAVVATTFVLFWLAVCNPLHAAQGSICMPTTGTVSGLTLVQDINAGLAALISSNSGGSAPANDCSDAAVTGQLWLDTSSSPYAVKIYSGSAWIVIGHVDTSGSQFLVRAGAGSVSLPSLTFADDTDTGLYRIGANNLGIGVGGSKIVDVASDGIDVTGTIKQGGAALLPPGMVFDYAGSSAPTGYLLAYGQCVSRTTYAALFAVISTTYDNECTETEFGIPDLRSRIVAGRDNMGGTAANRLTSAGSSCDGTTIGAECGSQNVTIAKTNIPNYNLTVTDTHYHNANSSPTVVGVDRNLDGATRNVYEAPRFAENTTTAVGGSIIVNSGGSGTALAIMPPVKILNKIIKY